MFWDLTRFCSQFAVYEGLADPDIVTSIAYPLPVGWRHNRIPAMVVINSEVNPASGDFQVTARINDLTVLARPHLSLQVGSRVNVKPDNKCAEDVHFSWVEIKRGAIPVPIKTLQHYHEDLIDWQRSPEIVNGQLRITGKAPAGSLTFEDSDNYCGQFTLYALDQEGYHHLATINELLPDGYHWTDPEAEFTEAKIYSDGRFEAVAEIWDRDVLQHDHLVLRVRVAPKVNTTTDQCETATTIGAIAVKK